MKHTRQSLRARLTHHRFTVIAAIATGLLLMMCIGRILPATETDIRRSVCRVNGLSQLCFISGNDTIVIQTDSVCQQGVWINRYWWWPSCNGQVLSVQSGISLPHPSTGSKNMGRLLLLLTDSISRLAERKDTERKELEYYLRSHGVQDEGYTRIAQYAELQQKENNSIKLLKKKLQKLNPNHISIRRRYHLRVSWIDGDDSLQHIACYPIVTKTERAGQPFIIQTQRSSKPWGAYAVRHAIWGEGLHQHIITALLSPTDSIAPRHTILTSGECKPNRQHDIPKIFAVDGSPVFTRHGRFVGIIAGKKVETY